jgi:hypothetical protein
MPAAEAGFDGGRLKPGTGWGCSPARSVRQIIPSPDPYGHRAMGALLAALRDEAISNRQPVFDGGTSGLSDAIWIEQ